MAPTGWAGSDSIVAACLLGRSDVNEHEPFAAAALAAEGIRGATGVDSHDVALVLGSGWAGAADRLGTVVAEVELSSLSGFAEPRVPGHRDLARSVLVGHRRVLVLGGRSHLYEGFSPSTVVHGVRTAAAAGCQAILLTNAAGSLQSTWPVGQVVVIGDHLNLTGQSPMVGWDPPSTMPGRFCDLTDAYSARLRRLVRSIDSGLYEGVYAGLLGGNYETPAEIKMLVAMGADLVGMSTVLETIAARHLGLEVLGLSLVTNLAAGLSASPLSHGEVLVAASGAEGRLISLIRATLEHDDFMP